MVDDKWVMVDGIYIIAIGSNNFILQAPRLKALWEICDKNRIWNNNLESQ